MNNTLFKMINNISEFDFGKFYRQSEQLKEGLRKSFSIYLDTLEELDDDTFWNMINELREILIQSIPTGLSKSINNAKIIESCDRFTWIYAFGNKNDCFDDFLRFVKTYNKKVSALYRPLFDVISGFGDDGYGDLLDSFPLWGRKRYEMALNSEIEGENEEQYQGENYFRMRLEQAVFEKFCSISRHKTDEIESEEMGKDAYYVYENKINRLMGLKENDFVN